MFKFNTVLFQVFSPQNVGMIIRSHVAFGGKALIFVGYDKPWSFKMGTHGFSRKLEKNCIIENFPNPDDFFSWSKLNQLKNVAIEISNSASPLPKYPFGESCNLIVGNEGAGIASDFLNRCDKVLYIPQFGEVECLNVAVSASIAMYELTKNYTIEQNEIIGDEFKIKNVS